MTEQSTQRNEGQILAAASRCNTDNTTTTTELVPCDEPALHEPSPRTVWTSNNLWTIALELLTYKEKRNENHLILEHFSITQYSYSNA